MNDLLTRRRVLLAAAAAVTASLPACAARPNTTDIVGRTWAVADDHVVVLELTY